MKKEEKLHLFYSIYLIFYLILKIYFKKCRPEVVVQIKKHFLHFFKFIYNNINGDDNKHCYYYFYYCYCYYPLIQ